MMYKNVIGIFGVPRSGTTWMSAIFDSCPNVTFRYQPLFSYRFKDAIRYDSEEEEIRFFFRELYDEDSDYFLNYEGKKQSGAFPIFRHKISNPDYLVFKETGRIYMIPHLLETSQEFMAVGIIRNPIDVLESWINAPREFHPEWDIFEEWQYANKKNEYKPTRWFGYYKWREAAVILSDMARKYNNRFVLVKYEDLYERPLDIVKRMFDFFDMRYSDQTYEFLLESTNRTVDDTYGVYRKREENKPNKITLPDEIKEIIDVDSSNLMDSLKLVYI